MLSLTCIHTQSLTHSNRMHKFSTSLELVQVVMCCASVAVLTVEKKSQHIMATVTGIAFAAVVVIPHLLAGLQWWRSHAARKARM